MDIFFVIFLTCVCGAMIGLYFYKRQKARLDYFVDLVGLINNIIVDVRYRQDKLRVVMTEYLQSCKSTLSYNIQQYLAQQDQVLQLSSQTLKKSELMRVQRFFVSLGSSDAGTQLMELDGYKAEFEQDLAKSKAHSDKYGTLYVKLGVALGIGVGILFV
jgi:hypothetical protein